MSPIGHSLVGASLAVLAMPQRACFRTWGMGLTAFVVLANIPDLPLPYWGHDKYYLSHSLFVNLLAITLVSICWLVWRSRDGSLGKLFLFAAALAWLSHLLLDSFYNHGHGIAIYWPVSDGRLNLAIPWLRLLDLSYPWWHVRNVTVMGVELLTFLPLLLLALAGRKLIQVSLLAKRKFLCSSDSS